MPARSPDRGWLPVGDEARAIPPVQHGCGPCRGVAGDGERTPARGGCDDFSQRFGQHRSGWAQRMAARDRRIGCINRRGGFRERREGTFRQGRLRTRRRRHETGHAEQWHAEAESDPSCRGEPDTNAGKTAGSCRDRYQIERRGRQSRRAHGAFDHRQQRFGLAMGHCPALDAKKLVTGGNRHRTCRSRRIESQDKGIGAVQFR